MSAITITEKNSKNFAKRLNKLLKEELGTDITLRKSQELLAKILGVSNWDELHHSFEKLTSIPEVKNSSTMRIDLSAAQELLKFFGGEQAEIVISRTTGHSGKGLYAWDDEYPEEGSAFLG